MTIKHDLPMLGSNDFINKRIVAKYPTMSYIYDDDELNHIILQNIADEWQDHAVKLYATTQYDYNPIENYRMTETGTRNSNGTETSQSTVSDTNNTHTDTSSVGTDSLKTDSRNCGKSDNRTTGSNTTTSDGTTDSTGKADSTSAVSKYGYNSTSPTATERTENDSATDSRTTTTDTTRAGSVSDSTTDNRQCAHSEQTESHNVNGTGDVTNTGKTTTDGSRTTTDSAETTLTRSGNIGVTTSQQMIQAERDIIIDVLDWYVAKFISGFIWGGI